MGENRSVTKARSVTRALQALRWIADAERPVGLAELARALDVPKTTLHDILSSLVRERYLCRQDDGRYDLDVATFLIGSSYLRRRSIRDVVHPALVRLCVEFDITVHFAILDGPFVLYLEKQDPPRRAIRLASAIGARLPAHFTAVGRACLASLPDDEALARVDLDLTAGSGHRMPAGQLRHELEATRRRGYAIDREEILSGVVCVAAAVVGPGDTLLGSIGVSYLKDSLDIPVVGEALVAAAGETSAVLGHRQATA